MRIAFASAVQVLGSKGNSLREEKLCLCSPGKAFLAVYIRKLVGPAQGGQPGGPAQGVKPGGPTLGDRAWGGASQGRPSPGLPVHLCMIGVSPGKLQYMVILGIRDDCNPEVLYPQLPSSFNIPIRAHWPKLVFGLVVFIKTQE